jgi:protein TonB
MKTGLKRNLVALLVMVVGVAMIFALLLAMNSQSRPDKAARKNKTTAITVTKKKKKPKTRKRLARRQRTKKAARPRAPAPNLAAHISGNSFGIPGLANAGVDLHRATSLLESGSVKDMVMTQESVDQPPRPMERVRLTYPPRARARGISGTVTLELLIGSHGEVVRVRVLNADPPGFFENAAVEAFKELRFNPARYRNQPVRVWTQQTVRFNLT